jgi:hypothetical protein
MSDVPPTGILCVECVRVLSRVPVLVFLRLHCSVWFWFILLYAHTNIFFRIFPVLNLICRPTAPVLETGFERFVVVDGLPDVAGDRVARLKAVLVKV